MPEATTAIVTLPKPVGHFSVNDQGQWVESGNPADAQLFDANQMRDQMVPLAQVRQALRDYHFALDSRMHGVVAQNHAFDQICSALCMHWEGGEETARRAAEAATSEPATTA